MGSRGLFVYAISGLGPMDVTAVGHPASCNADPVSTFTSHGPHLLREFLDALT